jgi:hypothetical protein
MSASQTLEERFKAVSSTHRLLVVTCFALVVFLSAPDHSEQYTQAIKEAEALQRIPFSDFVADCDKHTKARQEIGGITKEFMSKNLEKAVNAVEPLRCNKCEPDSSGWNPVSFNSGPIKNLRINDTIANYRDILQQNIGCQITTPLEQVLGERLKDYLRTDPNLRKLPKGPVDVNVYFTMLELRYTSETATSPTVNASVVIKTAHDGKEVTVVPINNVLSQTKPVEGTSIQDWLGKRGLLQELMDAKSSPGLLPRLSAIWDLVGDKRLANAQKVLGDKQRENQEDVEILGFTISGERIVIAAPLAMAFLLSYLAIHLRSISRVTELGRPSIEEFGWICTYEGRIPYTLAILSLVMLPLVGEIWLLVKVTRFSYLSMGAILYNLVVGIIASYYTRMLQLKHRPPPARGGLILPE